MITGLLQGSDKLNAISEFKLSHMCELEGVEAVGDNGTTGPFSVLNYKHCRQDVWLGAPKTKYYTTFIYISIVYG